MDHKELVVLLFDLWEKCEDEYIKKYGGPTDTEVVKTIFDRAAHHFIIKDIEIRPKPVPAAPREQRGDAATEKQLAKMEELGADMLDSWTKKEASEWIEKNKNW